MLSIYVIFNQNQFLGIIRHYAFISIFISLVFVFVQNIRLSTATETAIRNFIFESLNYEHVCEI